MKSIVYITILTCLALSFSTQATAQLLNSQLSIKGVVKDSIDNASIPFAHLRFVSGSDTILLSAGTVGHFNLPRLMKEPIQVNATAIGYKPFSKIFNPSKSGFNLVIRMQRDTTQLAEVIIVGKMVAIVMRGDTVQYNAGAFKTLEGDYVEKMIMKMPGISFASGSLLYNNEPIARILVDGENKFGNAGNTLKNLKSDDVKNIRVYDQPKKSDKELGMKNPRKEKVMDITTHSKSPLHQKIDLLFGMGREVPRPELSKFPLLYRFEGNYNVFQASKRLISSLKINNVPPEAGLEQQERRINGSLNYSNKISGWSISSNNSFKHEESYANSSFYQQYYPTENIGTRIQENQNARESKRMNISTQNNFSHKNLSGGFFYTYRNDENKSHNIQSVKYDGEVLSQTDVIDNNEQKSSSISASLNYGKKLTPTTTLSSVIANDFTFLKNSGYRMDTVSSSSAPTWLNHSGDGYSNRTLGRILFIGKLSPMFLYNAKIESEYAIHTSKTDALNLLSGCVDTANMRDYDNRDLKNSGDVSIRYLQKNIVYLLD